MSIRTLTTVTVVFALTLAACGGDTGESTTASPGPTATTAAPTTTLPPTTTVAPTTTTTAGGQTVAVYFSVDGDDSAAVEAFERTGPVGADPLELVFDELLAGPTAEEEAAGAGSFFSAETADAVQSVSLSDDVLTVDFSDIRFLNNASTSCGSVALLSSLSSTAFQLPEVERVRFTIGESCSLFWNWLQTECSEVTREGTVPTPVDVNALASGSGCTPGPGDLPDGRWFGYVADPIADELAFDLACWFSGPAATEAALEDGEEAPPPNPYHIRNTSTDTRTIPLASNVSVQWLPPEDISTLTQIGYADWVEIRPERDWLPGVWLDVDDGEIMSIEEQYQP